MYQNRKTVISSGCTPCSTSTTNKTIVTPITTTTGSNKHSCFNGKISKITKIGEEIFIMFEGCEYIKAPLSVLDIDSIGSGLSKEQLQTCKEEAVQEAIKAIESKLIKVGSLSKEQFKAFPI